jgi:manganese oxidase
MRAARVRLLVMAACFAPALGIGLQRSTSSLDAVVPNDNRAPGGRLVGGELRLDLVAQYAAWRPDLDVDSSVTVQVFGEAGGAPRVPGPLLRATRGTRIRVSVTNALGDSTLVVHGLRAGTAADDTLRVAPGARREITFVAGEPGTYLYWGTSTGQEQIRTRAGRDTQLTGAIVIDEAGAVIDPEERIFVLTMIDIVPDSTQPPPHEDIWELAINGRAWPYSERLEYAVGTQVRWRLLNGTLAPHPMHLHGFHFRVKAKGDGTQDTVYAADGVRDVVTEFMRPGSTFAMEWVPTRAGNWLFHCHMAPHITPYPVRSDSTRDHDVHDVARHPVEGMAGLVLGIRTYASAALHAVTAADLQPAQHLRLFVQQAPPAGRPDLRPTGYVLQRGAEPPPDSVAVPGPPLLLTRGETTAITVINRSTEITTVHWHGMELESVFDGVAGWSGAGSNLAPLIAPGDSFTVAFTPPRAGTFIYHTHMDEGTQLLTGSYGPLIVLEPGERFDPASDLILIVGRAVNDGENSHAINGRHAPPPLTLRAGTSYRLRIINILPAAPMEVELVTDSTGRLARWTPVAKDGAMLPASHRRPADARLKGFGVGEAYDFIWTPEEAMEATLVFGTAINAKDEFRLLQRLLVR